MPFKGVAVTVNMHGALLRTVKPLEMDSTIYLRVPNGGESPARVVRPMPGIPLTYGVELHHPQNIWGVQAPPHDWKEYRSKVKKSYISPQVTKHTSFKDAPAHIRSAAFEMLAESSKFVVTVDEQRRYLSVPQQFANLLGYSANEMTGMRIDDLTPKATVNVDSVFQEFLRRGQMEGFWLFQCRSGETIVILYRATRTNSHIQAEYIPLLKAA